jgi:hypothetical protein
MKNNNCFDFTVRKFTDIDTKFIPFFSKYPIVGEKLLNFQDLVDVSKLIKNKEHLTTQGIEKIEAKKTGMNKKRV